MDMKQANGIPDVGEGEVLVADIGAGLSSDSQGLYGPKAKIIRFDMREDVKPDVRCDIRSLDPHWFGKFDFVSSSHVVEHFRRDEAMDLIKHWVRLLKPGGKIVIHVPNFKFAVTQILYAEEHPGTVDPAEQHYYWQQVYGDQALEGAPWQHMNGFTPLKLKNLLTHACGEDLGEVEVVETGEGLNLKGTATLVRGITHYALTSAWEKIVDQETLPELVPNGEVQVSAPEEDNPVVTRKIKTWAEIRRDEVNESVT